MIAARNLLGCDIVQCQRLQSAISSPAKFWIHAAIQQLKSMCASKAARLDGRQFQVERAPASMKHGNCGMATKAGLAGKVSRRQPRMLTIRSRRCLKAGMRATKERSTIS